MRVIGHPEVDVHALEIEEAVDVGVIERLDAQDVGTWSESEDLEITVRPKGKATHDKRETIKEREGKREVERVMKQRHR